MVTSIVFIILVLRNVGIGDMLSIIMAGTVIDIFTVSMYCFYCTFLYHGVCERKVKLLQEYSRIKGSMVPAKNGEVK